ncbi:MAG: hypothetical protein K8R54_09320 [Bacteroidales bacterium]|nr:hypothetical protein [Bacteroidales bacterium]
MSSKDNFNLRLIELFQINKLNPDEKKRFHFVTFEKYGFKTNDTAFTVYEDWWIQNPEIVKSKITSILKLSNRIYARQCSVKKINKPEADIFLNQNHLYGSTNSKVKFGLFYEGILYGIATFAGQRQFRKGRSVELLRFCTKNGYAIIGGLDKLLQAYIKDYQPDTIMTYIDLDWGKGDAFIKLGFKPKETKASMIFYANKQSGIRIPEKYFNDFENINDYVTVKNKGSIKMIKIIKF